MTLTPIVYTVTDPAEDTPTGSFSIVTSPIAHDLCGPLTFVAEFDGTTIDNDDRPLSYEENAADNFTVQTDDIDMYAGNTYSYTLSA